MSDGIILGVDPGTNVMGYSLLSVNLRHSSIVTMGVVKMTSLHDQNEKLKTILESTMELFNTYRPTVLAIEAPFYGKNPQSMLKIGRAQGVVIAAAMHNNMTVFEYSPRKIKQAITGNGNASKEQVASMLQNMYVIKDKITYFDATDALAVAVCHHLQNRISFGNEKFSGWENFISKNKDRLIEQ